MTELLAERRQSLGAKDQQDDHQDDDQLLKNEYHVGFRTQTVRRVKELVAAAGKNSIVSRASPRIPLCSEIVFTAL